MTEPLSILLDELAQHRREGLVFAQAWPQAVMTALSSVHGVERTDWKAALNGTREAWECSWNGWQAPRRLRAIASVAEDPERVPMGEHDCPVCGGPLPPPLGGRPRVYCSARCQRAKHGRKAA